MKHKRNLNQHENGFSIIELMFAVSIFTLAALSIYGIFQTSLKVVAKNQVMQESIAVANEQLELVRNLSYDDVGVVGGVVSGSLLQNQTIVRNNRPFNVNTSVIYIDDPFDGTQGGDPDDTVPNDYKKVTVTVSWDTSEGTDNFVLGSMVAPRGIESTVGGGTLRVSVLDASGQGVPTTDIRIKSNSVVPPIDQVLQTNTNGIINIPGLAASNNNYALTATKAGYNTDFTCGIDPLGNGCTDILGHPNPTNAHASVLEEMLSEKTLFIDLVSTIIVQTVSQALPGVWTVNTDTTNFDQDNASIAQCQNGDYVFVWRDQRQQGNERIFAQRYSGQIQQWSPDLAVTTSNNQNNPDVEVDPLCNLYVTWSDDKNGNQDIYFEKYNSAGTELFGGSKKVETQANNNDQTLPQFIINASSTYEYIIWQDNRDDTNDIYMQRFDTNGISQWATEAKVNSDSSGNTQGTPRLSRDELIVDGNYSLYTTWHDNRNSGSNDIFIQKINNNGTKAWGSDVVVNSDPSQTEQKNPSIVKAPDGYLYVTWQDAKNGSYDIYLQKIDLNGAKTYASDIRIDSAPDITYQENPVLFYNTNTQLLYVVWQDDRNGNWDIYAQKIDPSDGSKQWSDDLRVNSVATQNQENPDILVNTGGYLVVAWQDNSGGDYDIVVAEFTEEISDPVPFPNIPLIVSGAKTLGQNPTLLKFEQNFTTDGNAYYTLTNLEWDSYSFTAENHILDKGEPPLPLSILPNSSTPLKLFISNP